MIDNHILKNIIPSQINDLVINYKTLPRQPKEKYYGNREYKRHLKLNYKEGDKENRILDKRCTQLLFRINEGNGKAVYLIGVEDDGDICGLLWDECKESIINFMKVADKIGVKINKIRIYMWNESDPRYCIIFKVIKPTNCVPTTLGL